MRNRWLAIGLAVPWLAVAGCGSSGSGDDGAAASDDGGPDADAGAEAAMPDGGDDDAPDAGTIDAHDAGATDAADAATADAATADASDADAATNDASDAQADAAEAASDATDDTPDASAVDTGADAIDASATDATGDSLDASGADATDESIDATATDAADDAVDATAADATDATDATDAADASATDAADDGADAALADGPDDVPSDAIAADAADSGDGSDGALACPGTLSACSGACVDLATDEANCSACGAACMTGATCSSGACACEAWGTVCTDVCASLAFDRLHCGDCATACPSDQMCFASGCGAVTNVADGANGAEYSPRISADTRWVVFHTTASNLGTGDTNGRYDVYLLDRFTGTYERESLAADGVTEGNATAVSADLANDASVVVFTSDSSNLVAGDVNANNDAFAYVRATRTLIQLTPGLAAGEFSDAPRVSGDGRYVVFRVGSPTFTGSSQRQAMLYDLAASTYETLSVAVAGGLGDGQSAFPAPSEDGRYVAFESFATNLVAGDGNGVEDVFVRDRVLGATTRVSVASDGTEANGPSRRPQISADGRWITFQSDATNLVAGDTNANSEVFLHDTALHTTVRASIRPDGTQPNAAAMPTGVAITGRVVFYVGGTGFVPGDPGTGADVLTFDPGTGALFTVTSRLDGTVSGGVADSGNVTPDGHYVVLHSNALNDLVSGAGGQQIYVRYVP